MPAIIKIGDTDTDDNTVVDVGNNTNPPNVCAINLQVARLGDQLSDESTISTSSTTVFANGAGVARYGDMDTDQATLISADLSVGVDNGSSAGAIVDNNQTITPTTTPANMNFTPSYLAVNPHTTAGDELLYDKDDQLSIAPLPRGTYSLDRTAGQTDTKPATANTTPTNSCPDVEALSDTFNWITEVPTSAWLTANPPYTTYTDYFNATHDLFSPFQDWSSQFQLSTNYNVFNLSMGTAISRYTFTNTVNQNGSSALTQKQTLDNMCYQANIVLEPLLAAYASDGMTITSSFRSLPGGSQHNAGQATDIQFLNFHNQSNTGQLYLARAQLIRDTFNFDQLILEWFGKNPWIHISSNFSGQRHQVLTQIGPNSYTPGLTPLS